MSSLDVDSLRQSLPAFSASRLDALEVFGRIESTNTHLLAKSPPGIGRCHVAIADHQTAGRGRHNRRWLSPPGAGLYLSLAYTFAKQPKQFPGLTLALGVGIVSALRELKIEGVSLKWPNDIVALDGKLGGLLTEVRTGTGKTVTVVTGVGVNIELPESMDFGAESAWAHRVIDLKTIATGHPPRETIAAKFIDALCLAMTDFAAQGFVAFADDWRKHDWLYGRDIMVDLPGRQISGIAAGVDSDGALLVDTENSQARVISGSVVVNG